MTELNSEKFLERLCEAKLLTSAAAKRAGLASSQTGTPIERTLLEFGLIEEEALFSELAEHLSVPFVGNLDVDHGLIKSLPLSIDFLRRAEVVPVQETDTGILMATSDPRAKEVVLSIGYHLNSPVEIALTTPALVKSILSTGKGDIGHIADGVSEVDVERLNALANDGPVIKLVNDIIGEGVVAAASDIHIEATESTLRVRFRVDGLLRSHRSVPEAQRAAVVSRLKIMANLNISEKRRPQDGRAQVSVRGRSIDIRLSTLPTQFGESIVMRLLDRSRVALDWHALGYDQERIDQIERVVNLPNGIFLVAGPTGSGKTTTLYTALSGLDAEALKIVTVEDPIEYSLAGINQVQVEPQIDMGFARALRAILRQDPNVIMIGEIRDQETAEIAVRAALVGRLVISTIHTNDAISAVTRLVDLGVPGYLLADTLRGVLSQRLVRTNCADCLGEGCSVCDGSGKKGRTVISEFFRIGPQSAEIINREGSREVLQQSAEIGGFEAMSVQAEKLCGAGLLDRREFLNTFGMVAAD